MECKIIGCSYTAYCRGWCQPHYNRQYRYGIDRVDEPLVMHDKRPLDVRFWEKVDKSGDCWLWGGKLNDGGYGQWSREINGTLFVHRIAYEMIIGPIPKGLVIDHLCRVRNCVNPAHMEPVTSAVNILRGEGACAVHARKTHCKRGHEFTTENTYIFTNGKYRMCKVCRRMLYHEQRQSARSAV